MYSEFKFNHKRNAWGAGVWTTIHIMGISGMPKDEFKKFIFHLQYRLPCDECKKHFMEYLMENPIDEIEDSILYKKFPKSEKLFAWTWLFHNTVNKRLNKPLYKYEDVKVFYFDLATKPCKEDCDGSGESGDEQKDKSKDEKKEKKEKKNRIKSEGPFVKYERNLVL